jgi:hypothetical protein
MIKKLAGLAIGLCLCLLASTAMAGDAGDGAGMQGLSLTLGYQGAYMNYEERSAFTGSTLDTDYGWLSGGFAEARYDFPAAFARMRFDAMGSNRATYDGSLTNGTPIKMTTHEFIYKTELDLGYKLLDEEDTTLSPYAGIGYRSWRRGMNTAPDYVENYTWWYAALGVNQLFSIDKWMVGYDAALLFPFSMKMETDMRGYYDTATFKIKSQTGLRIELPVSYEIFSSDSMRLSINGTPFYERWKIEKSPAVNMTSNGVPTGASYYEPRSATDIYGVRIGLGLRF